MRVLVVTNMYPTPARPGFGIFVQEQVESLRQAGVEMDVFAFDAGGRVANYGEATRQLHRRLREKTYDLLHAHYGLSGLVARLQWRYPVVVTFHGNDLTPELGRNQQPIPRARVETTVGKLVAAGATRCILVADVLKARLWPRSTITIPMGVDIDLFKPMPAQAARQQLGLDDRLRVLFVAHPDKFIKRFDLAQAAVRLLQEDGIDVELLPVYAAHHQQVPLYMNACDVLVLTSEHEASPCVVKEALACNLPVVSTRVGDVAERVEGVEGCCMCDRTPQAVAAGLRQVLQGGRRRLAGGRDKVQALSLPNIARRVMAVYETVMPGPK